MTLRDFFKEHPRAAIAFSGGVDSSFLLHEATRLAEEVRAYCVRSAFQPGSELDEARGFAEEHEAGLSMLETDILADERIASNPADRCYHCKSRIFSLIRSAAARDGFDVLLDGTNASDDAADRPGMKALGELGVLSPLRICGLTKTEIRRLSKDAGLSVWDKPSYACLATRIPTGRRITPWLLERTERAEVFLRGLGFRDLRVRLLGESARIQVIGEQFPLLLRHRERILSVLGREYDSVLLDLEARHAE